MSHILAFDTETTTLPVWSSPSGGDDQPHLVQLAAVLVDESREIVQSMNVIIKPEGWKSDEEAFNTHGITEEYARDVGVSEKLALEMFLALWDGSPRIAFNTTFDNRIIRIATKRYSSEATIDAWKKGEQGKEWICAMLRARKIIGGKQPNLAEAYKFFTGKELEDAHSAMPDTLACLAVHYGIEDHLAGVEGIAV